MDYKIICHFLGKISLIQAFVVILPLAMAYWRGEDSCIAFILTSMVGCLIAVLCLSQSHVRTKALTMREGIAVTGLGWLLATFLGMLPYVFGQYLGALDGFFESISGFTGTGATVITDLEVLPQSILLWRSMTHWLGGLGIVVIFIAILPESGQATVSMYNAEAAGPTKERVLPRLHEMTSVLFRMYMVFTLISLGVFLLCGMDGISAVNHALSTISAGGFSTYNNSAAHFDNPFVEGWMTFFMILAGGNFGLYYQVYQKGFHVLKRNTEFKVYLWILLVATICIGLNLISAFSASWDRALRFASFQAASIATTGFVSADYDRWPTFSKGILMLLMISGGCAGSTAAGIKVSRLVILCKAIWATVSRTIHPHMVIQFKMNGKAVSADTVIRTSQFFFLYIAFIVLWAFLLTWDNVPVFDAIGISVSTMGCIGPAFGITGATCTYAELSIFSKSILCLSMLIGRLEMFTILVMCRKSFWKMKGLW